MLGDRKEEPGETCWHCHTTKDQTGKKRGWDRCDQCGVMLSLDPKLPGILPKKEPAC